ncbi:uncharacterized protein LOC120193229 [Hibiscus syriacus]|uniref:uncharacterized protein LOC120193229 n=1 Tax=Hibiscus syriacus TaxID=106335 RepID=UPI001922BD8D|nr:uncharacterized protein LOC120193229 [Hibiscus syriacus]
MGCAESPNTCMSPNSIMPPPLAVPLIQSIVAPQESLVERLHRYWTTDFYGSIDDDPIFMDQGDVIDWWETIELKGEVFLANFIELTFGEFDVILGMDWLAEHDTSFRCKKCQGCEAFLAHVVDTRVFVLTLEDIYTVREYSDVFSEELLGLSPDREIKFSIEDLSGSAPVSIAPYCMMSESLNYRRVGGQEIQEGADNESYEVNSKQPIPSENASAPAP